MYPPTLPILPPGTTNSDGDSPQRGMESKKGNKRLGGADRKTRSGAKRRRTTGGVAGGVKDDISLEIFNWMTFQSLGVLGTGRSGTVFKTVLNKRTVALKLYERPEIESELVNEVQVYNDLKDLQGISLPTLRAVG